MRYYFAVSALSAENLESGYSDEQSWETAFIDSDTDGIDDATELELGTSPQSADTDGDGMQDGDEVECHSNPADPQDLLEASLGVGQPNRLASETEADEDGDTFAIDELILTWQAKPNLTYQVETSSDQQTWTAAPSNASAESKSQQTSLASGPLTYHLPVTSASGPRFFRVRLLP
ncbi:MAG: thrombospondin type 3 repeat-containing protein [Lentisphaerae bacterium]|nr:thrombospondin type 3 repeat-containing protein [Lentisphaerota bacterium]